MTEQEFKDYYSDLLILQYRTQPKARGTISALVSQSGCSAGANGPVNYLVAGSPTIVDGIASGFSLTDFLILETPLAQENISNLVIGVCFTTPSVFNHSYEGICGTDNGLFSFYFTQEGVLHGVYRTNLGTHDNVIMEGLQPSTTYYAKMNISGEEALLSWSLNGKQWTDTLYNEADQHQINDEYFMVSAYPFAGSLNLNHTYIQVNNQAWFGYSLLPTTLPQMIIEGYDVNTAVGNQLDIIGKYVGLKRQVKTLIGDSNTNVLNDKQYRTLLKLKMIKNTSFSSTSQLRTALYNIFPTSIRLYDNRNMTYQYQLSSAFNDLINVILAEELLPVPMALGWNAVVVPNLLQLYGYSDYSGLNDNPNGYSDYQNGFRGKYLSYGDKIDGEENE